MADKNKDANPEKPGSGTTTETKELSLLDTIIAEGKMIRDPSQRQAAEKLVKEYVTQILDENKQLTVNGNTVTAIQEHIAYLDKQLEDRLNEILHDSEYQKLEASWRGLHYFVMNTETSTSLKIRLMNAKKEEVLKDLRNAIDTDQSVQFKQIYEEEYGTFGGHPYSVLIGDYYFGRHADDVDWLRRMSKVAAAAHAPFIASADPKLFDMDYFTDLKVPRDLAKAFETSELSGWREFRDTEDSRYVALCMPRFLLRPPYGAKTAPVEGFSFEEDVNYNPAPKDRRKFNVDPETRAPLDPKAEHPKYLWGNAAYALGQRITNAFAMYKWTAAIRGVEGGGLVQNLPHHNFLTDEGDIAHKCPTEVAITDRREKELNDLGFISLVHRKNWDTAAFFGGQTVQKPLVYNNPKATANARISSQLPYILAASRFAHYLKVIMRDKVGSFETRETVEKYLNTWIADYVLLNDNASQSSKASYPLREARVDVFDIPGKPGCYTATVYLRPHFQLEELTASIRLVAELPPPAAA